MQRGTGSQPRYQIISPPFATITLIWLLEVLDSLRFLLRQRRGSYSFKPSIKRRQDRRSPSPVGVPRLAAVIKYQQHQQHRVPVPAFLCCCLHGPLQYRVDHLVVLHNVCDTKHVKIKQTTLHCIVTLLPMGGGVRETKGTRQKK